MSTTVKTRYVVQSLFGSDWEDSSIHFDTRTEGERRLASKQRQYANDSHRLIKRTISTKDDIL